MTLVITAGIAGFLTLGVWWFARRRPGYRHRQHTISELGEQGARDTLVVSWGLFAPVGAGLLGLGLPALASAPQPSLAAAFGFLSSAVGVGYLGGAIFPCDPGSPTAGSWRQQLHNLAGAVEYGGGTMALWYAATLPELGATWLAQGLLGAAVVVGAVTIGLSLPGIAPIRGLVQRVGEAALFSALLVLAALGGGWAPGL